MERDITLISDRIAFLEKSEKLTSILRNGKRLPEAVFQGAFRDYLFFEFERLFTIKFLDGVWNFASSLNDNRISAVALEPDPVEYFYRNFGVYPAFDIEVNRSPREFLRIMNRPPPGGNIADALIHNGRVLAVYGEGLQWCIYGEMNLELAIIAVRKRALQNLAREAFPKDVLFDSIGEALNEIPHPLFLESDKPVSATLRETLVENYPEPDSRLI